MKITSPVVSLAALIGARALPSRAAAVTSAAGFLNPVS